MLLRRALPRGVAHSGVRARIYRAPDNAPLRLPPSAHATRGLARQVGPQHRAADGARAPSPPPPQLKAYNERLSYSFTTSSGPGGQHVNRVATRVELRLALPDFADVLGAPVLARLRDRNGGRLSKRDELLFTSQASRSQSANAADALRKLQAAVDEAWPEPKERNMRTGPSATQKQRGVSSKRQRGQKKNQRRGAGGFD